jgi:hypothetical protein
MKVAAHHALSLCWFALVLCGSTLSAAADV